jgi:diacylglycerol O-acyltransferase / wax synthase
MTPVDSAWSRMDGPVNLAEVTGVFLTGGPVDFEQAKEELRGRLRRFDRFHQRVVEAALPIGPSRWEDIPGFDAGEHVHRIVLPAPQDESALVELVSALASTPLDRSRPLWQIHVVESVGQGSALVFRFHHCMADGTASIALCNELFPPAPAGLASTSGPSPSSKPPRPLDTPEEEWSGVLRYPARLVGATVRLASGFATLTSELLKPSDPPSPLKGELGAQQRVAWSDPVSLEDLKVIGRSCEATVNDVLVAAMTGALRDYLAGRGHDVERGTLRAVVPVNLRPREHGLELGNDFGLVILDLAIDTAGSLPRLGATRTRMGVLKRSREASAMRTLFKIFGVVPKALQDAVVDLFSSRASLVLSNVVGPTRRLAVAGVPIERMVFCAPHPGRSLGMGVGIVSYAGSASLAVLVDARLVPDPETVTRRFNEGIACLLAEVRGARESTPPQNGGARVSSGGGKR